MLEFAIISGLKCTGNIDDYMYTSSSKLVLMLRYFFNNKGAITRSKLITRVQNGNFDNVEDALNLAILFFVHTFMFSQHKEAPQDFNTVKQLYSLDGMPHVLNVWMFECCSEVESKNVVRQRNAIPRIQNWSVQCIRPNYESFMSGMFTKHSYKNIQPTTDEVRRLNLSFSKDFELCDPTTYDSTSDFEKLKRTAVEIQQRVGTIAEEFGDFSTIPLRKILIKAGFESPDAADKGEIGVSEIQHHHYVEIGVSTQSHQYKSVPSSSTQPEETSKSSLDGDEIKNYINKCFAETMTELVTLISKIHAEVVKALKNEQNKQSQEDKIDEQQQSQKDGSNKQERQHKSDMQHEDYNKGSLNDMEVSCDEESNKQNLLEEQQLLDVNLTAKEDVTEVNLKNQKSTDVTDVQHLDVIFYHLRKKSKIQLGDNYRYTTTSCFFKTYVEKTHTRYYPAEPAVDLSTQQDYAESIMVAKNEDAIANIIQGFCMPAGLLWYMVDEVYVPINFDNDFYDKTERTDWPLLEAYKGKITQQTDLVNEIPFDVDYVQNIPQQASDCLDCGVFVCAYAEILSEGLQVHSYGFDSACQHARYASLLWHYEVEKENEGYTSDNGDPPRPRKSVIEEIEVNAIVTLE
ncbi:hypothetical protein T459_00944 [Capsicum annuum]|uniref:Ubiquitin-like protease family profile domain-containing protein n=1 Tax=Capsicum annuum TaxID=4072 RepID=A0A2G3AFQ0_CAPAN|nr:hypothetical protein T459_00944 [Capsicum annuum]